MPTDEFWRRACEKQKSIALFQLCNQFGYNYDPARSAVFNDPPPEFVSRFQQIVEETERLMVFGPPSASTNVPVDPQDVLATASGSCRTPGAPSPSHSADYTFVNWYGTEYTFALGVQSSAVKVLWEEWENTRLGLHQDTIRDAIDAERDNFRMDTSFRNHPAFGSMIVRCGDGRYRLAPPADTSET